MTVCLMMTMGMTSRLQAPPWLNRGSHIFLVSSAVSLSQQPDSRRRTLLQFCKNLWRHVQGHLDWLSMLCSRLLWDTQIQMLLTCWLHEILPLGFSGPTTAFLLTSSAFAGPSSSSLFVPSNNPLLNPTQVLFMPPLLRSRHWILQGGHRPL